MSNKLWIGNVPPETSDADLVELVKKYSGRESKVVERVDRDGTRPGCILEFAGLQFGELDKIARRIEGLYWKERTLTAYHPLHLD